MSTPDDRAPTAQFLLTLRRPPATPAPMGGRARRLGAASCILALVALSGPFLASIAQAQPTPQPAPAQPAAPPPASPPALPPVAVVVVDDGVSGAEPWGGAQEAVGRYKAENQDERANAVPLLGATAAKAEEVIRGLAQNHPSIVVVGAGAGPVVEKVARDLPGNRITLIGAAAQGANIRFIQFRDQETEWLAGWLAGKFAADGDVGLVSVSAGAPRSALCAVAQGLASAAPDSRLLPELGGPNGDLKTDAQRGAQQARLLIDRGARVVLTPGGGSGAGAMNAVHDAGALGVTRNAMAAALFPHNLLAAQTRNYGAVVLEALRGATRNWTPGAASVGLADDAIALIPNSALMETAPLEVRQGLEEQRAGIAGGSLPAIGLAANGTCPMPERRPSQ